uniref:Uncharacterized protein n=1 Tax=Cacopsylla melanoneura TaxID=428564 RepID=A0A8D8LV10_9HEMI
MGSPTLVWVMFPLCYPVSTSRHLSEVMPLQLPLWRWQQVRSLLASSTSLFRKTVAVTLHLLSLLWSMLCICYSLLNLCEKPKGRRLRRFRPSFIKRVEQVLES